MVDHKYQEESEDGSNANLNPQDEWSHNLVEPGQTVYWELESDTPDIDGIYYERKMINHMDTTNFFCSTQFPNAPFSRTV